jgi:hypothetical protein
MAKLVCSAIISLTVAVMLLPVGSAVNQSIGKASAAVLQADGGPLPPPGPHPPVLQADGGPLPPPGPHPPMPA